MPAASQPALDERHAQIIAALQQQFQPQGFIEEFVLATLARAAWDMERLRNRDNPNDARLAAQYERSFYRALTELRRLQTDRALREPEVKVASPAVNPSKLRPKRPTVAQIIERAMQQPPRRHRPAAVDKTTTS
ncbi:MAG: hypothetical protein IT162_06020 [Bryobacterales bacterium]|nr:hypothetical protein [Bryobacterales bacterium]